MIEIEGVSHQFGDRSILKSLNLKLNQHRIGIVGSNGSGKSTFVRLLNGLLIPNQGSVKVDELDTRHHTKTIRRKVGFVFQNPDNQIVFPTVEEDIAFGLKNLKLDKITIQQRVQSVLEQYQLWEVRHSPAHLLSGGEKQLLAIAAVLVMQPQYIIFDEPSTLLDLRNRNRIQQVLKELSQPIVVVSHDLDLLKDFERILVFDSGRVVMDDIPAIALPYYVEHMS